MKNLVFVVTLCIYIVAHAIDKDRGGGNSINGRPIESYMIDIQQNGSFQRELKPLLRNIEKLSPSLYAQMAAVISNKLWYLIPVPLDAISPEVLGLAFKSDQAAMQSYRSVWLSQPIFDHMTSSDQATLILHELFLGVRLYEIAQSASPNRILSAVDYEQIRFLTVKVFKAGQELKSAELQDLLSSQGFSSYPERTPKNLSLDELFSVINPIENCRVEIEKMSQEAVVKIMGLTRNQITTALQPRLVEWEGFLESYSLPEMTGTPKEGDTRQHLAIYLKENKVYLIYLTQQRYRQNKQSNSLDWQYESLIQQCGNNRIEKD